METIKPAWYIAINNWSPWKMMGEKQKTFWRNKGWKIIVLIKTTNSLMEETQQTRSIRKYTKTLEKWSISYHVNKQGCHSHQWSQPSRASRKENNTCNLVLQTIPSGCSHSLWWTLRKNTGYWLQIAEMHMKERISVRLESCVFPYTEKC